MLQNLTCVTGVSEIDYRRVWRGGLRGRVRGHLPIVEFDARMQQESFHPLIPTRRVVCDQKNANPRPSPNLKLTLKYPDTGLKI